MNLLASISILFKNNFQKKSIVFLGFCLLVFNNISAQTIITNDTLSETNDTIKVDTLAKPKNYIQQLRVSTDLWQIGKTVLSPNVLSFEFQADFNTNEKNYWVVESGFGRGKVDYDHLKYTSNAAFVRMGIDRSLLQLKSARDLDIAYIGVRYAAAFGKRSDATIIIRSPFGGADTSTIAGDGFFVHWGEITAGMKMEIVNRFFLGWNGRAKFFMNAGTFKEIAPKFIAGYGRGDKTTTFDINLYLGYALFRKYP